MIVIVIVIVIEWLGERGKRAKARELGIRNVLKMKHRRLFKVPELIPPKFLIALPKGRGFPNLFPMDKLEEIFQLQEGLNRRIGVDTEGMSEEEQVEWVLNYTRAMQQELAELTDSVPWKWWAKYQKFDRQNARVEVVDLFHFLVSLGQVLGMSADDIHRAYVRKNVVNHQRQESGYAYKDERDSRHI